MASQDWLEKDFYKILGVSKDASDAEIKKSYRSLSRKYHPDVNRDDTTAEARFKEVSEAYSVLSDKDERGEYDQIRAMQSGGPRFSSGGSQGGFEDVFWRTIRRWNATKCPLRRVWGFVLGSLWRWWWLWRLSRADERT